MTGRGQGGFTLLEMLVAIMVFGLLVSLVYGMLRMGSRGWEAGAQRIEQTDAMRIGWTFLQRALNNARTVEHLDEDGEGIHFLGTEEALEFVADMPAYLGTGGLHVVSLGMEDAQLDDDRPGPARRLVLRRVPLLDYGEELDRGQLQSAVLVDQVESVRIAYYGELSEAGRRPDPDEAAEWHSEWVEAGALPILIQIAVQPYDASPWPTLVAHPQLGRDRKADGETDELAGYDGGLPPGSPGAAGGEAAPPEMRDGLAE